MPAGSLTHPAYEPQEVLVGMLSMFVLDQPSVPHHHEKSFPGLGRIHIYRVCNEFGRSLRVQQP